MDLSKYTDDEKYMWRCLQLARHGRQYVAPNPMVGSVIVCDGKIIGEGFHREYGNAHAEVYAIASVKNKELLKKSTLYVSLEPCSHYGKTPPCAQLIIDSEIPKVVISTLDPYPKVSGRGVQMLKNAGIEVLTGVLQNASIELNKEFFVTQKESRPYVYLKWAETKDGFIDRDRLPDSIVEPTPISNNLTKILVHKMRSEVSAIMVGTNTALNDNPSLTTRFWSGKSPIRIVLDRNLRIPSDYILFDNKIETIVFTEKVERGKKEENIIFLPIIFDQDMISSVLKMLSNRGINSLLVEGGASLLQSFIDAGVWDEAYIEIADCIFGSGIKSPNIRGLLLKETQVSSSITRHLKNLENYKIL